MLAGLESERADGFGPRPIPDPLDDKIAALIRAWMALDDDERETYGRMVTRRLSWVFLAFSERMATRAVRERDTTWIVLGLAAQGLDGWRFDARDNMLLLSLHHDACERLAACATEVFSEAARVLSARVAAGLLSFVSRSPADKSLSAMGYTVAADADGFRYQRTW